MQTIQIHFTIRPTDRPSGLQCMEFFYLSIYLVWPTPRRPPIPSTTSATAPHETTNTSHTSPGWAAPAGVGSVFPPPYPPIVRGGLQDSYRAARANSRSRERSSAGSTANTYAQHAAPGPRTCTCDEESSVSQPLTFVPQGEGAEHRPFRVRHPPRLTTPRRGRGRAPVSVSMR
jgi:hypothetical protein